MTVDSTTKDKKAPFFKGKGHIFKAKVPKNNCQVQSDSISTENLSSKQNLQQLNFATAGQELISQEECMFALKRDGVGFSKSMVEEEEDKEEKLNKKSEDLFNEIWSSVGNSLNVQTKKDKELLKNAVLAIQQEEQQDKRWEGIKKSKRPPWRPRACKKNHDLLLQNMVEQRMEEAKLDSDVNLKSSVQLEITAKAKRLKEDLLQVAKHVKNCYPKENVVQFYAELYHNAFSAKLREITDYGLANKDCTYVLQWVNNLYPGILRQKELSEVINYEKLQPLLPDNVYEMLENQFLTYIEAELETSFQNALSSKETIDPKLQDECYYSPLAHDLIPCIHGVLTSAQNILPFGSKTLKITHQIHKFLTDYQSFLEKVIKDNLENTDAVLKANLHCIREFRNYILTTKDCIPEEIKNDCINLLASVKDNCHGYFTKPIHDDLKGKYSKLGTQDWLKHNESVCNELLDGLDVHLQKMQNLDQICFQELIGQLHEEVLVRYVQKMMRKKLKLKDEEKQHLAAEALRDNSRKIHTFFTKAGSTSNGLEDILPILAELLTLKDPQCIELQLVMLSKDYPDLSEEHVAAWLHLKANLSNSVLKNIKKTFSEHQKQTSSESVQDSIHPCSNFFSKVELKKQRLHNKFLY
ncbi:tumor necrosis factor alpha-induced protein 2 [Trichomycterus rosablanca]|uniref:tumor necrosis factor alpha-induced protein 2 n=1 Tax=Trichomycterus rosablanca TaxID=2290929 RepID=UPI002F35B98F